MKKKMIRPYLTRKNLILIAVMSIYAVLFAFTGLCLVADGKVFSLDNPLLALGKGMGYTPIEVAEGGMTMVVVSILLIAVYIILLTFMLVYIRRFAVINNIKGSNKKLILVYVGAVLVSILLSYGLSVIIAALQGNGASIAPMSYVLGYALVVSLLVSFALAVVIGAVAMLIVNIHLIDKPYRFFSSDENEKLEDMDDDQNENVASSFDKNSTSNNLNGDATLNASSNSVSLDNEDKARDLDTREKVFPGLSKVDEKYSGFEVESVPTDDITLEDLATKFRNYLAKEEHLYFDIETIRIFLASLGTSHFMILEGLSGTGKSSLPRFFAKFINAKVTFIPVQATWRDKSSLLGYFNDFSRIYNETDFLLSLYEAGYNPDQINIFVLDEMNISRVEYYFADFLSVLEYPSDEWKIRIMQLPYGFVSPTKLIDGNLQVTPNSFFIGTANKDDSTFSIADKVYDRSITVDFQTKNEPFSVKEEVEPIHLSYSKLSSLFKDASAIEENHLTKEDLQKFNAVTDYIYEEFDVAFGNRILNQIETIVPLYIALGGKKEEILDFMLTRKVLCKLEGRFEDFVKPALKNLLVLLDKTYGKGDFPNSAAYINKLIKKL
ncbi:MAG: hypothetical protein SPJ80_02350 [Bacilli bacterium]|nr:hypothetical protein [Bacilli bacterium]